MEYGSEWERFGQGHFCYGSVQNSKISIFLSNGTIIKNRQPGSGFVKNEHGSEKTDFNTSVI